MSDAREILSFLTDGTKAFSAATIWVKDQEGTIASHLVMINAAEQTFQAWIPEGFDIKKFLTEMRDRGSVEYLFSVTLARANVFFKTNFKTYDSAGLKFTLPKQMFKVQRRKNARLIIPTTYSIKVEFQDPLFDETVLKKKLFDVSAGGLAFLTASDDTPLYPSGLSLKNFHFNIKHQTVSTAAEVRHISTLSATVAEKTIKVGVIFNNISRHDADLIASYVFDESRKLFSKLL